MLLLLLFGLSTCVVAVFESNTLPSAGAIGSGLCGVQDGVDVVLLLKILVALVFEGLFCLDVCLALRIVQGLCQGLDGCHWPSCHMHPHRCSWAHLQPQRLLISLALPLHLSVCVCCVCVCECVCVLSVSVCECV